MIVHFPIALLMASLLLDFLSLATKKESFGNSAFHLLCLGVLGGLTAIVFGFVAEDFVQKTPMISEAIETHETFAMITVILFILLLGVRYFFNRKERFQAVRGYYLIAALVGVILLATTAYYGGQLVYHHGVAVNLL